MEDMLGGSNETDLFSGSPQPSEGGVTAASLDLFGDAQQPVSTPSEDLFGAPATENASEDIFNAPQEAPVDDIYAQGPVEPEEPEVVSALVEWEENRNKGIAEADEKENSEIQEVHVKAQEELDAYNKKVVEAQENRAKNNLSTDEQTIASLEETSENQWERVVKYVDFNRSDLHEKDVSKMKSLLLQLKH